MVNANHCGDYPVLLPNQAQPRCLPNQAAEVHNPTLSCSAAQLNDPQSSGHQRSLLLPRTDVAVEIGHSTIRGQKCRQQALTCHDLLFSALWDTFVFCNYSTPYDCNALFPFDTATFCPFWVTTPKILLSILDAFQLHPSHLPENVARASHRLPIAPLCSAPHMPHTATSQVYNDWFLWPIFCKDVHTKLGLRNKARQQKTSTHQVLFTAPRHGPKLQRCSVQRPVYFTSTVRFKTRIVAKCHCTRRKGFTASIVPWNTTLNQKAAINLFSCLTMFLTGLWSYGPWKTIGNSLH